MKAVLVEKARDIKLIEKEKPKVVDPNHVLIEVKAVGLCGSDVHIYHGTNPLATYPRTLGHEFSGKVVEVGCDVKNVSVGDKVCVEPIVFCGECYPCSLDRPNVCDELEVCGVHRDGGMQEFFLTTEEKCTKLPDNFSYELGALAEPFTIAAQSTWRGSLTDKDTLLIIGAGPIGLAILLYAKQKGATCIIADVFDYKLDMAKEFGADYTINSKDKNLDEELKKITDGGYGPSITIDSACTVKTFEDAVRVTRAAGRVVVLGFNNDPSAIPAMHLVKKELSIYGTRLETHKFPEVVEAFAKGDMKPERLISHKFKIEDIQKAFDTIDDPEIRTVKVMVTF